MKQTTTNLGAMIRRYRVNEALDLRTLAQRIGGISHSTLMRVEHGYAIDGVTLMALMNWMLKPSATNGKEKR